MKNKCRFCGSPLEHIVVDLGLSPVSNHFRSAESITQQGQMFYPLTVMVCEYCWLVQLTNVETDPHFTDDYVYFSSNSTSWLEHARRYAEAMIARMNLGSDSRVVELASNDGYLLQYFKQAGVPVLGVEPTANTAREALDRHGIESVVDFFTSELAVQLVSEGKKADLIAGNNVLAHVPDISDFVRGISILLKPKGTVTLEFPHLLRMLSLCQFDTIYHEHFSYLSLLTVERVLETHGLTVYGVEEISTHGGSLRVYAAHQDSAISDATLSAGRDKVRADEAGARLHHTDAYSSFGDEVANRKVELLEFLLAAKRDRKKVVGYGAPAKGNTMLNYCGIGPELLPYTVDRSPHKQGKYLPGVNIPVRSVDIIADDRPDYILILPWNLRDEIIQQLAFTREWGATFVVAIPNIELL